MVAAAGSTEGIKPWLGLTLVATVLLGLVAHMMLADRYRVQNLTPLEKPTDVLLARSQEIVQQLGFKETPADAAHGFFTDYDYLNYIQERDKSQMRWQRLGSDRPATILFWYRQSPREIQSDSFFNSVGSGVITAVECPRKSDPYRRHVSGGVFESARLTGKNSSVGLRSTWYVQLTADHTNRITTAITRTRSASGMANSIHHARRPNRKNDRKDANRVRRARDVTTISATTARRSSYSPRISRSRRLRAVIRSFIFSERAEALVRFFGGVGRTTVGVVA